MLCIVVATILSGFVARAAIYVGEKVRVQPHNTIAEDTTGNSKKPQLVIPDSLRAAYRYTDALKRATIHKDTAAAREGYLAALEIDSLYAPALYQLAYNELRNPGHEAEALKYARRAYTQDSMNKWYIDAYARSLVLTENYDEALPIYRRLMKLDRNNPDNYRILAMVYQQRRQPFSAISILDSADTSVDAFFIFLHRRMA